MAKSQSGYSQLNAGEKYIILQGHCRPISSLGGTVQGSHFYLDSEDQASGRAIKTKPLSPKEKHEIIKPHTHDPSVPPPKRIEPIGSVGLDVSDWK